MQQSPQRPPREGELQELQQHRIPYIKIDKPRKKIVKKGIPDGTFNGYPIYHRSAALSSSSTSSTPHHSIHSSVQCVGQNFRNTAWIHRSCHFHHFCFDTAQHEFVIYQSEQDNQLERTAAAAATTSSRKKMNQSLASYNGMNAHDASVAIGGINTKWTWSEGVPRLRWFPKVINGPLEEDYYELDDHVVWVPYHSFFAQNPGHLVWDDFLPIFTLLRIFNLYKNDGFRPLLMRYVLPGVGLWATCDFTDKLKEQCRSMYHKFLPLFGLLSNQFSTNHDFVFNTTTSNNRTWNLELNNNSTDTKKNHSTTLVCAAHGAAGLGMLTDHGYKLHGWTKKDYESMHNHGRGSLLYEFRNFMMDNLGLPSSTTLFDRQQEGAPYIITFASSTSRSTKRHHDFGHQINALTRAFGSQVVVRSVNFPSKSVHEQVQLASESSIYITFCGGGAVTAMFAPKGASIILYFVQDGGKENNHKSGGPAMLDWDLFDNMGWVRTHWLPANTMDAPTELDMLVQLVARDLDVIADQMV